MKTPWAILLTKFSDTPSEPYSRTRYEEIFTTSGAGKWNMVDYFRDMSHGKLDLTESKVFGWHTLDQKRSEYVGSGANPQGRRDLLSWARQKATDNERLTNKSFSLDPYYSVVVVLNVTGELFGGGAGVVCGDDGSNFDKSGLSPSFLGQEMGHAYGLLHSRQDGSEEDYTDPFDVMSNDGPNTTPHPLYTARDVGGQPVFTIGPGLNAANMWSQGWLDDTRVWKDPGGGTLSATVQLRPLHRRDLPGYLAARFSDFFVEFRMQAGWDAAFQPAVLVHRFENGHSYLVRDNASKEAWEPGSSISTPNNLSVFGSGMSITVLEVDSASETATVRFGRQPAQIPREWPKTGPYQTPYIKWSDVIGANEALLVVHGKPVVVSVGSPMHRILESVALHESGGSLASKQLISAIRNEAVSNIATVAQEQLGRLQFNQPLQKNVLSKEQLGKFTHK